MGGRAVATRRLLVAAGVSGLLVLATSTAVGASPTVERAAAKPVCQEWQTITQVPVPGSAPSRRSVSGTASAKPRTTPVCRNAPPKPFAHSVWIPDTVVGGARLAAQGLVVDLPAGVPAPPTVPDVSYVVADLDSGAVLAAKSPHAWLRPASTLKTLTALALIPLLDPKTTVVAKPEQVAANGTRVGIIADNKYPVGKLLDALLMFSANDAAYLLAEAAGGYDETLRLMNAKAAEIGAHDTIAVDPSGLDEDGQHSSAYDLALIGRAAMKLPEFRKHVAKRDAVFPGGKVKGTGTAYKSFHIYNINELLPHYPGAIGIKPGRTNRAQHTFIGAATRDGRTIIVSQMGSTTGDWEDTAALLDWGFAQVDNVVPVGRLVEPGEAGPPRPAPASTGPSTTPDAGSPGGATAPPVAAAPVGALVDGPFGEQAAVRLVTGVVSVLLVGVAVAALALWLRRRRLDQR